CSTALVSESSIGLPPYKRTVLQNTAPAPFFHRSFDLQTIRRVPQVERRLRLRNFFRLQATGVPLAWAAHDIAASLAAATIIRISLRVRCWCSLRPRKSREEGVMRQRLGLAGLLALLAIGPADAQDKIKIGVIVTLSGPAAALGGQVRDGFALAVKDLGGKMGGRDVEVVVADDELKPDAAVTKVKGLLERDKVDFVVGPIFSNILLAIHKPVIDTRTFLISPNAGPSSYAGKECSPFFYVTSYQNDQVHEILGKVAQDRGYKRVYLLVPNYQAGRDSVAGFRLDYKGEIVEESYVPLGTLDFQPELSKISSQKPDAVFTF